MPSYSRTTKIAVDQDTAYAYLSKAENLPEYFPQITKVTPKSGGNAVETTAVIEPPGEEKRTVQGTAWFESDDESRKVSWGSEGSSNYHGVLDFDEDGDSSCTVTLTLNSESDHPGIEESIDETLQKISSTLTSQSSSAS